MNRFHEDIIIKLLTKTFITCLFCCYFFCFTISSALSSMLISAWTLLFLKIYNHEEEYEEALLITYTFTCISLYIHNNTF